MEVSKSYISGKTALPHSTITQQEVTEQIYFLRKLEEHQEENQTLQAKIKMMEQQLSKKNANRPLEADLTEVLTQLLKKNSKLESELSKTVHRQNEALAEIRVRKQSIKLARNERVIHSGIFKNIQKEIKFKQDVYKNLLIDKKLEQLGKAKSEQEYNKKIKGLYVKIKQLERVIQQTKEKKQLAKKTFEKQKQSYILRRSILPVKINYSFVNKESILSTHRRSPTMDKVLYEYNIYQLQEEKLLKLTGKESLEQVSQAMQSLDNEKLITDIQVLTQKIDEAEDQLKKIKVRDSNGYQQHVDTNRNDPKHDAKKHLISKINQEKKNLQLITQRAHKIAERYEIRYEDFSQLQLFQAIQNLIPKVTNQEPVNTSRSDASVKLTQLLMKSKHSKENQELMSETKFKEIFSNLHDYNE